VNQVDNPYCAAGVLC